MTVKEHLRKYHEQAAAHHVAMQKIHASALKKARAMENEEEIGDSSMDDFEKDYHADAATEHGQMAQQHLECCKALDASNKAMGMEGTDRDGDWPSGISALAPDAPHNVRAILRAGQREIGKVADVADSTLEKVIGLDLE